MRQRRWLELLKDYDVSINYHPGKANVVADALSRKSNIACLVTRQRHILEDLDRLRIEIRCHQPSVKLNNIQVQPALIDEIKITQNDDLELKAIRKGVEDDKQPDFVIHGDGSLRFRNRLCVPNNPELKKKILKEAHRSGYTMHPGGTKMYKDLKETYWWNNMKRDICKYVSECEICQQVKAEHQRPAGLTQSLDIPMWKWEKITMDFVTGLPRSARGYNAIWVIVDRLTKSAHFLPINMKFSLEKLAKLYIAEIVRLHGVPVEIISDRDPRFVSEYWKGVHKILQSKLCFSSAYHPQTDGQSERTIQTLEDMLRCCILDLKGAWEEHLPLAEFAYNNSYQSSIKMAPYEALYGRKCRSPIHWDDVGERKLLGPELIQQAIDKIYLIREHIRRAQSRQKSYADCRKRDLEFKEGDHVFLKVSPRRGVKRFGIRGKLSPRFVGPFEILQRVGEVAYRLALPPSLAGVHNVFHISMLRKFIRDPDQVIELAPIKLKEDLTYEEQPERIVDQKEQVLRRRTIKYVKIQWKNHTEREATWELEDDIRDRYPELFGNQGTHSFEDETF